MILKGENFNMNIDNIIKRKNKLITSLFFYNIIRTIGKLHFTDKEVSVKKLIKEWAMIILNHTLLLLYYWLLS